MCFGGCPDGQLLYSASAWQPEGLVEGGGGGAAAALVEGGPVLLEREEARGMLASQVR